MTLLADFNPVMLPSFAEVRDRIDNNASGSPAWPAWEHDQDLAALYAPKVSSAFYSGMLASQLFLSQLVIGEVRVTPTYAAQEVSRLLGLVLRRALEPLWTEGYALGAISARHAVQTLPAAPASATSAASVITKLAGDPYPLPVTVPDWQNWQPGDLDAAAKIATGPRLTQLLQQWGVNLIQSISQTRLGDLAQVIASALAEGKSAASLAQDITGLLNVPSRAKMIAQTEIARAMSAASLDTYLEMGVSTKAWLVAPDEAVCKICRACEAEGPIPLSQSFLAGIDASPAHPHCRCGIIPASVGDFDLSDMTVEPLPGFNLVPLGKSDAITPQVSRINGVNAAEKRHKGESAIICGHGHKHWGKHGAAGILIRAPRPSGELAYLLQQRADTAYDSAGKWGVFGGALLEGETPQAGADRELAEETGTNVPLLTPISSYEDDHGGWAYTTFVADAPATFWPAFDGETPEESANWGWFTPAEMKSLPLHPGFKAALPKILAGETAEKALRRQIELTGQETWHDVPDTVPPAAGGGAMSMPPVPGGVPGFTAGAEPPRWDGSSPQPRVLAAPSDQDDADYPQGRVRSERPHAAFPSGPQGMDGYWPAGGLGTGQAPVSSPGGARGVSPSTVGGVSSKASAGNASEQVFPVRPNDGGKTVAPLASDAEPDLVKVGPHGYVHGWVFVGIPSGKAPAAGDKISHHEHGSGVVTHVGADGAHARFDNGTSGILGSESSHRFSKGDRVTRSDGKSGTAVNAPFGKYINVVWDGTDKKQSVDVSTISPELTPASSDNSGYAAVIKRNIARARDHGVSLKELSTREMDENSHHLDELGKSLPMAVDRERWKNDKGVQFTSYALDRVGREPTTHTIAAFNDHGDIAGAVTFHEIGSDEDGDHAVFLDHVGSTGSAAGVGTALAHQVARYAADRNLPVIGSPYDDEAKAFWRKIGWEHEPLNDSSGMSGWAADRVKEIAHAGS